MPSMNLIIPKIMPKMKSFIFCFSVLPVVKLRFPKSNDDDDIDNNIKVMMMTTFYFSNNNFVYNIPTME